MGAQDSEKEQATLKLLSELAQGKKSGEEEGWLSLDEVEANLGVNSKSV